VWSPEDVDAFDDYSYHFKVLGIFHQSQYNVPSENRCPGPPVGITFWTTPGGVCTAKDDNVVSGFDTRVTNPQGGTGSGHSIHYGDVQQEQSCSVGSGDLRAWATLGGTMGSLSNSTVAVCPDYSDLHVSGLRLFIRGLGVKTVTDDCQHCCTDWDHLDNFTTDTSCSGIGDLPSALTVILY
jgi:hypothetical protein